MLVTLKTKLEETGKKRISSNSATSSNLLIVLKKCLEQANMLIFSEALRICKILFKKLKTAFNYMITRDIILLASTKYQIGKKNSTVNDLILSSVYRSLDEGCIPAQTFLEFILDQIQHHKKMNTKECFLVWLQEYYPRFADEPNERESIHQEIDKDF